MSIDYKRLLPKCPECKSTHITNTELHKQIFVSKRYGYTRKEVTKYICKSCKNEWWM